MIDEEFIRFVIKQKTDQLRIVSLEERLKLEGEIRAARKILENSHEER